MQRAVRCTCITTRASQPLLRAYSTENPKKKTVANPSRRHSLDFTLLGLGVAAISGLILFSKRSSSTSAPSAENADKTESQTFTIPMPSSSRSGERKEKTLALMTPRQVEARLHEHEESFTLNRPKNPVFRFDTTFVASNNPVEDDHVVQVLSRDPKSVVQGDMLLFAVLDGHAGWHCSRLLSEKLVPFVAKELNRVFAAAPEYENLRLDQMSAESLKASSKLGYLTNLIKRGGLIRDESGLHLAQLDESDAIVQHAIKTAFLKLDEEICQAPVKELQKMSAESSIRSAETPSTTQTAALQTLLPALAGSCALLSYIDTARNRLHVACTGDSRAIMGTLQQDGKWKVQVLSEDQTGRNPKEVERMRKEHPASEKESVIQRGRVLGGLEPTRAFGDAIYKYEPGLYDKLLQALHPGNARRIKPNCSTPPYVTARPEIVTVPLLPASSDSNAANPPKRFIVMATDGLWDRLENDTVAALVAGWLDNQKDTISELELLKKIAPSSDTASTSSHLPNSKRTGQYVFEDLNLSTHLIRNALGGADKQSLAALLSIPAPLSRRYRDDITATVILLGGEGENAGYLEGIRRLPTKSKL